jgi:hypothetical protein
MHTHATATVLSYVTLSLCHSDTREKVFVTACTPTHRHTDSRSPHLSYGSEIRRGRLVMSEIDKPIILRSTSRCHLATGWVVLKSGEVGGSVGVVSRPGISFVIHTHATPGIRYAMHTHATAILWASSPNMFFSLVTLSLCHADTRKR